MSQGVLAMDVEEKKVFKEMQIKLNQIDLANMATEAGEVQIDLISKLNDRRELNKVINSLKTKVENILEAVNTGVVNKSVEVVMRKVFSSNMVQYLYEGEVLEERAMTESDRQADFVSGPSMIGTEVAEEAVTEKEDIAAVIREEKNPMKAVAH